MIGDMSVFDADTHLQDIELQKKVEKRKPKKVKSATGNTSLPHSQSKSSLRKLRQGKPSGQEVDENSEGEENEES